MFNNYCKAVNDKPPMLSNKGGNQSYSSLLLSLSRILLACSWNRDSKVVNNKVETADIRWTIPLVGSKGKDGDNNSVEEKMMGKTHSGNWCWRQ